MSIRNGNEYMPSLNIVFLLLQVNINQCPPPYLKVNITLLIQLMELM